MAVVAINRKIGAVAIDVVLEEIHTSTLSITRNPVEFGADVTDHAYREPRRLTMNIATGKGREAAARTYQSLVRLQNTRIPFDLSTGLDYYKNMLIEAIAIQRAEANAQILNGIVDMLEIIFASSASTPGLNPAPDRPAGPGSDGTGGMGGGTVDMGPQQPVPEPPSSPGNSWIFDYNNPGQ